MFLHFAIRGPLFSNRRERDLSSDAPSGKGYRVPRQCFGPVPVLHLNVNSGNESFGFSKLQEPWPISKIPKISNPNICPKPCNTEPWTAISGCKWRIGNSPSASRGSPTLER